MKEGAAERLQAARDALAAVDPWTQDGVQQALDAVVEQTGAKPGQVFQPIRRGDHGHDRVAGDLRVGRTCSGREKTLARIDRALAHAREGGPPRPPSGAIHSPQN